MESEILQTLKEIRGTLYVIAAKFFVDFSVMSINAFIAWLNIRKLLKLRGKMRLSGSLSQEAL